MVQQHWQLHNQTKGGYSRNLLQAVIVRSAEACYVTVAQGFDQPQIKEVGC
jgi:hypothetical protein